MTDTPQLVERLRELASKSQDDFEATHFKSRQAMRTAAAEIERLQSKLDRLSLPGGEDVAKVARELLAATIDADNGHYVAQYVRGEAGEQRVADGVPLMTEWAIHAIIKALSQPRPEPSMDDVERVARAIYAADPIMQYANVDCIEQPVVLSWDDLNRLERDHRVKLARAALQSLPQAGEREAIEAELTAKIVAWLRSELTAIPRVGSDCAYWMGESDAFEIAIEAIERGDHLTQPAEGER